MPHVSLTRLRIRSVRFMPFFALHAFASTRQVQRAPGYLRGALLPDEQRTYWTMTAWESRDKMLAFMTSGAHKQAMPRLLHWCDEASVAHWEQPGDALPSWDEADRLMRTTGRPSKVLHPGANHASLTYRPPRTTRSVTL